MKIHSGGFTLIELLIYMFISFIILFGVANLFGVIGDIVYKSNTNIDSYQDLEQIQDDLDNFGGIYSYYQFSTGSIFSKSSYGFDACIFTNEEKTKGFVLGVMNNNSKKLTLGTLGTIYDYTPFIQILDSATLSNILSKKNIVDADLGSGNKIQYPNLHVVKFSCEKKSQFTRFDFLILQELYKNDFGISIGEFSTKSKGKVLPLSLIK